MASKRMTELMKLMKSCEPYMISSISGSISPYGGVKIQIRRSEVKIATNINDKTYTFNVELMLDGAVNSLFTVDGDSSIMVVPDCDGCHIMVISSIQECLLQELHRDMAPPEVYDKLRNGIQRCPLCGAPSVSPKIFDTIHVVTYVPECGSIITFDKITGEIYGKRTTDICDLVYDLSNGSDSEFI